MRLRTSVYSLVSPRGSGGLACSRNPPFGVIPYKLCRHSPGGLLDNLEDSEGHCRELPV
jgi:hypothetical protein